MQRPHDSHHRPTSWRQLPACVGLIALVGLAGCASTGGELPGENHATALPSQYTHWFTGNVEANMGGDDWQRVNYAQRLIEEGDYATAENQLRQMINLGFPPAYYHMGRMYEDGLGVERNTSEAARHYAEALELPSSVRGHASLNMAKLYLAGDGVQRHPSLAYYLLWQALEEGVERDAEITLAELMVTGDDGVQADLRLAHRLYQRAADRGDDRAMLALAAAYRADGWLVDDPQRSRQYTEQAAALLQAKAETGDTGAMQRLARLYSEDGLLDEDPQQRLEWLMAAAESGEPGAQTQAARILLEVGEEARALELLETATQNGDVDAMAILGDYLLQQPSQSRQGAAWLERASERGSTDAAVSLARAHLQGNGVAVDPQRAIALLEHAAEQEDGLALALLGDLYLSEEHVPSQPLLAVGYLQRGHEAGHPYATTQLGEVYLTGRGVGASPQQAEELLREAAAQGQASAKRVLGAAYLAGEVLAYNPSRAERLLREAIEAGDTSAMVVLGEAYLEGIEGELQPERGISLLEEAVSQGDAYAMVVMGRAYRHGDGVERDLERSLYWLQQAEAAGHESAADALVYTYRDMGAAGDINALISAAEEGHPGAMADLGRAYLNGQGVTANTQQAQAWLERADRTGHPGAAATLARLHLASGDEARARDYLDRAVASGHRGSQARLGDLLVSSGEDTERGIELLTLAADAGHDGARLSLGQAYLEGEMVSQDTERGLDYVRSAADNGHTGAMATLGREYLRGELLEYDAERGSDLLLAAAEQGHESARLALAEAYLAANGLESANNEQALIWLEGVIEGDSQLAAQTLRQLLTEDAARDAIGSHDLSAAIH